jgi:hypothetical protein
LHLTAIAHRGDALRERMQQRAAYRCRRRQANLRSRAPRFNDRRRANGWFPPSLRSRIEHVLP